MTKTPIEDYIAQTLGENEFVPGDKISIKDNIAILFDIVLDHINANATRYCYRPKNQAAAYGALKRWVREYTKTYLEPVTVQYDTKARESASKTHSITVNPSSRSNT